MCILRTAAWMTTGLRMTLHSSLCVRGSSARISGRTRHEGIHSPLTHSSVLMQANDSHYLRASVLLWTGGLVWELYVGAALSQNITAIQCLALCLSLGSAESPV